MPISISKKKFEDLTESVTLKNKGQPNKQLFNYEDHFKSKIDAKKQDGTYREFKRITRSANEFPIVLNQLNPNQQEANKKVTIWCSNDYLGLGRHDYVKSKVIEAVNLYGVGSGGTRNISGSSPLHYKLEDELARLHQKESALLFTSCYVANDTTLYTLAKLLNDSTKTTNRNSGNSGGSISGSRTQCHILSDSGNHASMIQGIRNSGINKIIFKHNDLNDLELKLKSLPLNDPKIVAFESVHSMDGSISDINSMCDIIHKYGGISYIDEVHAVGLYGHNGAGIGERDNVLDKMDIITGTLGKAFGNIGGYICASSNLVDMIRSYGSGFIFTTSLPPSVLAGSLAAIHISRSDEGRQLRLKHQLISSKVKYELNRLNIPVMNNPSHIVPVLVGNSLIANQICNKLMNDYNIYIQSINYPTVQRGTERLRIVPNPHHNDSMVQHLVEAIYGIWNNMGLKFQNQQ